MRTALRQPPQTQPVSVDSRSGRESQPSVDQWPNATVALAVLRPGTSNHGKGEAVDVGNASGSRLAWLEKHAKSYGWAWELASEPWHIHYLLGDALPAGLHEPTEVSQEDDMAILLTTEGAIALVGNRLVFIAEGEGIDSDKQPVNQWDLRKAPKTWANFKAAFGPIVRT